MSPFKLIKSATQSAALLAVAVIAALSLVPGGMRPHTGEPKQFEHFAAYAIAAALLSFAFGKRHYIAAIALYLSIYSAALEIAQTMIPGRDGEFFDFIISSGGACTGCFLAWMIVRILPDALA